MCVGGGGGSVIRLIMIIDLMEFRGLVHSH